MHHLVKFMIVAAVTLVMSACVSAPPPGHHIDQAARPHLETVDTYLVVQQDNIVAGKLWIDVSGGHGLGFFPISTIRAIDQSTEEKSAAYSESLIAPIRDAIKDYDFAEVLTNDLNNSLGEIEWLHTADVVLLRDREDDLFLKKHKTARASATLFIEVQYVISPDLNHVSVSVEATIFPKTKDLEDYKAKLDGNENPVDETDNLYLSRFRVNIPLKEEGLVKDRVNGLIRNYGEKVKSALTQCAAMVAEYLGQDIERDETADNNQQ